MHRAYKLKGNIMKKLLLALVASATVLPAFAAEAVVASSNQFDSTKIMCGTNHVNDGIDAKQLGDMHCKKFQDHKTNVMFWDDNSKKLVHCKVDKTGKVTLAECKAS